MTHEVTLTDPEIAALLALIRALPDKRPTGLRALTTKAWCGISSDYGVGILLQLHRWMPLPCPLSHWPG
jgi:hypothetical protein